MVGSMEESAEVDQVKRKDRFLAEHEEWEILSPLDPRSVIRGETGYRALGPPGLIRDPELGGLLDQLEKLTQRLDQLEKLTQRGGE